MQCKGTDNSTAVTLRVEASPCPLLSGSSSSACEHVTELENLRSSKLYSITVLSKTLGQLIEFTKPSPPGQPAQTDIQVIEMHPVISSNATQKNPYAVSIKSGVRSTTEDVETIVTFFDQTQKTKKETLVAFYEFPIP
jgi:hypothetical protein